MPRSKRINDVTFDEKNSDEPPKKKRKKNKESKHVTSKDTFIANNSKNNSSSNSGTMSFGTNRNAMLNDLNNVFNLSTPELAARQQKVPHGMY